MLSISIHSQLLSFGADATCLDDAGQTPLQLVLIAHDDNGEMQDIAIDIVRAGGAANLDLQQQQPNRNTQRGVLDSAMLRDWWQLAHCLAEHGVGMDTSRSGSIGEPKTGSDFSAEDSHEDNDRCSVGEMIMSQAVSAGDVDRVKVLLKLGWGLDWILVGQRAHACVCVCVCVCCW